MQFDHVRGGFIKPLVMPLTEEVQKEYSATKVSDRHATFTGEGSVLRVRDR